MSKIEWGAPIKVEGDCPSWLSGDTPIDPRDMASEDCIGYKRESKCDCFDCNDGAYAKASESVSCDMVTLAKMSEAEAIAKFGNDMPCSVLRRLGLIREPTQAETIATKTGLTVDQVQSVLNEVNNGTR